MDRLYLTAVSIDSARLLSFVDDLRATLNEKDAEYDGPKSRPPFKSGIPLAKIRDVPPAEWSKDPPDWVSDLNLQPEEISKLLAPVDEVKLDEQFTLHVRGLTVYNNRPIQAALRADRPPSVVTAARIDTVSRHATGSNVPSGYDPNQDNQPHQ